MSTLEHETEFPKLGYNLIIAMKGLPCTGKSEIANAIGKWAGSPVLYIDDFLYTLFKGNGYTCESPPPNGEAARLHEVAFDGLCEAASHRQRQHNRCVVIKSRLDSTYELKRLAQLGLEGSFRKILIIECRTKNDYRWEKWSEKKLEEQKDRHWYKPKNWRGVREYRDDILGGDPLDFGRHFRRLFLERETLVFDHDISPFRFQVGDDARKLACWIEVDPFNDLTLDRSTQDTFLLTPSFLHVIKQLLSRDRLRVTSLRIRQPLFPAMKFQELRFDLLLVDFREEGGRSEHLCGKGVKRCFFRAGVTGGKCGACEEAIAIDPRKENAYACFFCPLALHKSCAKLRGFQSRGFEKLHSVKKHPYRADAHLPPACDSCKEGNKSFSYECCSCLYQNYLKQQVFPTIVDHESHTCLLSIKFEKNSVCKACNDPNTIPLCSYGCYLCSVSYNMECLLLPQRLEHEHGGYRHDMELKYSRSRMNETVIARMNETVMARMNKTVIARLLDMEDEDEDRIEEVYWCDVCYQEMDPRNWFYSCQNCHYEAHPFCTNPFSKYEEEFASKLRETASSSTP